MQVPTGGIFFFSPRLNSEQLEERAELRGGTVLTRLVEEDVLHGQLLLFPRRVEVDEAKSCLSVQLLLVFTLPFDLGKNVLALVSVSLQEGTNFFQSVCQTAEFLQFLFDFKSRESLAALMTVIL